MTPEGKVKAKIRQVLVSHGAYIFMPVQTGYGMTTLDFLCCVYGFFVAIEAKAGKGQATPRQEGTMQDIRAAGGYAIVVNEDLSFLREMLDMMKACYDKVEAQDACSSHQG